MEKAIFRNLSRRHVVGIGYVKRRRFLFLEHVLKINRKIIFRYLSRRKVVGTKFQNTAKNFVVLAIPVATISRRQMSWWKQFSQSLQTMCRRQVVSIGVLLATTLVVGIGVVSICPYSCGANMGTTFEDLHWCSKRTPIPSFGSWWGQPGNTREH